MTGTYIEILGEGGPGLAAIFANNDRLGDGFGGRVGFEGVDVTVPTHL